MKVAIVIINFNSYLDTIMCIESVLKSNYSNFSIILVDNKSTDSSFIILSEYISNNNINNITLIESLSNNGFASGNNIAFKYIINSDFDAVWMLNNDTIILPNTLEALCKNIKNDDKVVLGSTLLYYDDKQKIQCLGGGRIYPFFGFQINTFNGVSITKKNFSSNKIDYISGASAFFKISLINDIGFMPEEYFLYWEETDYFTKALRMDYKMKWVPESIVYHKVGASTNIRSKIIDYYNMRNVVYYFKKYYSFFYLPMIILFNLVCKTINRIIRCQFNRIPLLILAAYHGLISKMGKVSYEL